MKSNAQAAVAMNMITDFEKQGKMVKAVTGIMLLAATGLLDFLTGYELAFSLFYLILVFFAAWFLGRWEGIAASFASALVLFGVDIASGHLYHNACIPFLNAGLRLSLFVIASVLLSELKTAMEREKELASTDYLTGAANARRFFELLEMECERLQRYGRPFTVAYMDLDNFKKVNDQFGHLEGDKALCTIVKYASEHLRKIDVVARLGGDELAFLMPEINDESAHGVLVKLKNGLTDEMARNNWPVTFSIGAVTCNSKLPETRNHLMKLADTLMYSVKNGGKNGIAWMTYTE
jgi:diguanylate cyclase (GGDEF)-like protein